MFHWATETGHFQRDEVSCIIIVCEILFEGCSHNSSYEVQQLVVSTTLDLNALTVPQYAYTHHENITLRPR